MTLFINFDLLNGNYGNWVNFCSIVERNVFYWFAGVVCLHVDTFLLLIEIGLSVYRYKTNAFFLIGARIFSYTSAIYSTCI